jgi:hypothetical protein
MMRSRKIRQIWFFIECSASQICCKACCNHGIFEKKKTKEFSAEILGFILSSLAGQLTLPPPPLHHHSRPQTSHLHEGRSHF